MREIVHSDNVAPDWTRRRYCVPVPASCLPATQAKPRADQPLCLSASASLPAVAQLPGVSASARHERCVSPLWSTIAPVIGPLACRCTAYRLSVDPNFFKKSRGRFSLLKGPSSVSILFPRYLSRAQPNFRPHFPILQLLPGFTQLRIFIVYSVGHFRKAVSRHFSQNPQPHITPLRSSCLPCSQSPSSGLRSLQETFWSPSASPSLPL